MLLFSQQVSAAGTIGKARTDKVISSGRHDTSVQHLVPTRTSSVTEATTAALPASSALVSSDVCAATLNAVAAGQPPQEHSATKVDSVLGGEAVLPSSSDPPERRQIGTQLQEQLQGKQHACEECAPASPHQSQAAMQADGDCWRTDVVSSPGNPGDQKADTVVPKHVTPPKVLATGDPVAPTPAPSSQKRHVNEQHAQEALLLLQDEERLSTSAGQKDGNKMQGLTAESAPDDVNHMAHCAPFRDADGNLAYEVDKIIDHSNYRAGSQVRTKYLVRWKGYGPEDDTWQSKSSLRHAQQAIKDYEASR